MTKFFAFLLLTVASFSFSTGCRLTNANVIGKWKGQLGDTLIINKDNTFMFIKEKVSETGKDSLTFDPKTNFSGQWTLLKKSVYFKFSDSMQNLGGGCNSYQYWRRLFSKRKLVRPTTCKIPTHHFTTITRFE